MLNPITAMIVAVVHIYLSFGHLAKLFGGDVQWTHIWKGFGALAGAYVFAALASRGLVREGKNWFRFYGPEKAAEDKSWKMADIERGN